MADLHIYRRTTEGFIPANDASQEFFGKTKLGQLITMTAKRQRSLKFHRLFFAILTLISENSEPHITEEMALYLAKVGAGVGQWINTPGGKELFCPGSISFASMDEEAFQGFVRASIPPLVQRFMAGTAPEAVIREATALAT